MAARSGPFRPERPCLAQPNGTRNQTFQKSRPLKRGNFLCSTTLLLWSVAIRTRLGGQLRTWRLSRRFSYTNSRTPPRGHVLEPNGHRHWTRATLVHCVKWFWYASRPRNPPRPQLTLHTRSPNMTILATSTNMGVPYIVSKSSKSYTCVQNPTIISY